MITVLSVAFVDDAGICAIAILEAEGVLAHARQNVAWLDLSTTQSMSAEVGWTSPLLLPFALEKEGLSRFHGARRPVTRPFASQGPLPPLHLTRSSFTSGPVGLCHLDVPLVIAHPKIPRSALS